jgi:aryl-alcohol dehydrogenase-like predicted oxidoreductase
MNNQESFMYKDIPAFGKRVHRLGLAANYGITESGVRAAFERGMNYIFYNATIGKQLSTPLIEAIQKGGRERFVISSGPTIGYFGGMVRRGVDGVLKKLGTDHLDVAMLHWLGKTSAWTDGTVDELKKCKESGKAKILGISIHDRPRAGKLAEDSPLDLFMIRYNAAHPGAESDIFPHCEKRHPVIVAYTATSWKKLLGRPSGWQKAVPTAGDCYRFCLSSPFVDIVLCGPGNEKELDENLKAMEKGPLDPEEMAWMREFGRVVSGKEIIPRSANWL